MALTVVDEALSEIKQTVDRAFRAMPLSTDTPKAAAFRLLSSLDQIHGRLQTAIAEFMKAIPVKPIEISPDDGLPF